VQAPQAAAAPPQSASVGGAADLPRRVFLIVMDDAGLGLAGAIAAQKAAKQFLSDATRPGDLVSLVVPAAGLTWSVGLPEGQAQIASLIDSVKGRRGLSPALTGDWEALLAARSLDPTATERARVRMDAANRLPQPSRLPGESDRQYEEEKRALQESFLRADAQGQLNLDRLRRRRLFESVSAAARRFCSSRRASFKSRTISRSTIFSWPCVGTTRRSTSWTCSG